MIAKSISFDTVVLELDRPLDTTIFLFVVVDPVGAMVVEEVVDVE